MIISYLSAAGAGTLSPDAAIQRSQWQSPVPYLFGGLAAMLGLIAFALLILACSYWKLSDDGERGQSDGGGGGGGDEDLKAVAPVEEKFVVIMAGEEKPTFLATRRAASFSEGTTSLGDGDMNMNSSRNGNENPRLDPNQIEVTLHEI